MRVDPTSESAAVERAGLGDWLAAQGFGCRLPVEIARVGAGQSNLTSILTDGAGNEWVLREAPAGEHDGSAHDLHREARVLEALSSATPLPVPQVVAGGTFEDGRRFFVMTRSPGSALSSEDEAAQLALVERRALSGQMIETLAQLHNLDAESLPHGLHSSRRPQIERVLERMTQSWQSWGGGGGPPPPGGGGGGGRGARGTPQGEGTTTKKKKQKNK
ncbi:phosphotransferase, partial [Streptomyces hirsutus]|uniref:phosphotransferase family protein n=1 Tax=Streptomyces hirsutus TaxID=35620 RepID=UPI00343E4442